MFVDVNLSPYCVPLVQVAVTVPVFVWGVLMVLASTPLAPDSETAPLVLTVQPSLIRTETVKGVVASGDDAAIADEPTIIMERAAAAAKAFLDMDLTPGKTEGFIAMIKLTQ